MKKMARGPTCGCGGAWDTCGWGRDVGVGVRLMRAGEGGVEGGGGHKAVDLLLRNHKSATLGGV